MSVAPSLTNSAVSVALIPTDVDGNNNALFVTGAGTIPYATLINGPGEFAGAIGPSGSKKTPVVRALWQGNVNSEAYDANVTFVLGAYAYAGGHTTSNVGKYTTLAGSGRSGSGTTANSIPVGIVTHVPTASEPWLGVASLL
jgi:hypothetical protein